MPEVNKRCIPVPPTQAYAAVIFPVELASVNFSPPRSPFVSFLPASSSSSSSAYYESAASSHSFVLLLRLPLPLPASTPVRLPYRLIALSLGSLAPSPSSPLARPGPCSWANLLPPSSKWTNVRACDHFLDHPLTVFLIGRYAVVVDAGSSVRSLFALLVRPLIINTRGLGCMSTDGCRTLLRGTSQTQNI